MRTMTKEEERRLIRKYQRGDSEAAGLLLAQHDRALHYMASRMVSRCESPEDLFQQACVFFLKSIKKYNLRNKTQVRVTTWCYRWVEQQLRRYVIGVGLIRIPSNGLNTDRDACVLAMKGMQRGFMEDRPELSRQYDDLDRVDDRDERQLLQREMRRLNPRHREILEWRMLGWKLREIGDMMGISRERVRQISDDGLARLRERCAAKGG